MKKEYQDIQADGEEFKFGYDRFDNPIPYLYFESTAGGEITLKIDPHHLRKLAMRLIKLSYRVDIKE